MSQCNTLFNMTPKSPWKTSKEKNDFKAPTQGSAPRTPAGDSFNYAQAQEDEVEVLKAIYMDDYEEVEVKNAWSVSTLRFEGDLSLLSYLSLFKSYFDAS